MKYRWLMCWLVLSKRFTWHALRALVLIVACSTCAQAAPFLGKLVLPPGSTQTPVGEQIHVLGMPFEMQLVDIPEPLAWSARFIAERYPELKNLGVDPDRVMLGGRIGSQRWLVCLESAGPKKTTGRVSVMTDVDVDHRLLGGASTPEKGGMAPYVWLPQGARLMVQVEQKAQEKGRQVKQEIWFVSLPVSVAWNVVLRGLKKDGWKVETLSGTSGQWTQKQRFVHLSVIEHKGGSAISLQRQEPKKP